jgi:hypothetical protein
VTGRAARALWLLIGTGLLLIPMLPLPQWTGAADQGPIWAPNVQAWAIGLAVVIAVSLVAARLSAGMRWAPASLANGTPVWAVTLFSLALTALALWVMRFIFNSNPQLIDEIAQLFQARIFTSGRLAAPVPHPAGAFWISNTGITAAGWMAQYPPVHPLLLALGLALNAQWLVNPVVGGLSVPLLYVTTRGLYGRRTAFLAMFLWVSSTWVIVMSGTYMNHVPAVTFTLAAWALTFGPRHPSRLHWLGTGLALAAVAATRPLDAVAAALPIVCWVGFRRAWWQLPWMVLGGSPIMLVWGYMNWRMFGNPMSLGYTWLYGPAHGLGFHVDPWGNRYTAWIALSNLESAIRRLHLYLYEWPIPALLPLGIWAVLGRQFSRRDFVVGVGAVAAPVLYFFYWHSGFYPGPRFYYAAAPFLVIGTARACIWAWRAARHHATRAWRFDAGLVVGGALVLLWGAAAILPLRLRVYREGLATLKLHPERQLAALGVQKALVIIPESWGSRTQVRLVALGVHPGLAEQAYRRLDTCDLYRFVVRAEEAGWDGTTVLEKVRSILDTAGPAPPPLARWPDHTIRLRPGAQPRVCQRELERDLAGFTLYDAVWRNAVGLHSGIVFARDLFERNNLLFAQYPGWELWRYAPRSEQGAALPVLTRLGVIGAAPTR